jgi:cell division protein FtsQ
MVWIGGGALILAVFWAAGSTAYQFSRTAPLFRLAGRQSVALIGNQHVSIELVRDRFVADYGHSLWQIPLEERRLSVEEIPWVEAATVSRFLPNRLGVRIRERSPVAFLRQGRSLWLVDAQGAVLPIPPGSPYNFPVITGVSESATAEERRAQLRLYLEFVRALDLPDKTHSRGLSEVDVSHAEDLCATVTDKDGALRLHFGRDRYQEKYESFLQHRSLWKGSGEAVRSIDLRYRGQIVLNPDSDEAPQP